MKSALKIFKIIGILPLEYTKEPPRQLEDTDEAHRPPSSSSKSGHRASTKNNEISMKPSSILYCLLIMSLQTIASVYCFSLTMHQWAKAFEGNRALWNTTTMGVLCAQTAMLTQTVPLLWSLAINWPKFLRLANHLVRIETDDDGKVARTSARIATTSNVRMMTGVTFLASLVCYSCALYTLAVNYPDMTVHSFVTEGFASFASFFGSAVGSVLFFNFNSFAENGFKALVNDKLGEIISAYYSHPATSDDGTSNQPARLAWQESEASFNLANELDAMRKKHGQLCEAVSITADAFSSWILWTCLYMFAYLVTGSFGMLLTFKFLGNPEMFQLVAFMFYPPTILALIRVLLVCRSASNLKSEEKETSRLLASLQRQWISRAMSNSPSAEVLAIDLKFTRFETQLKATSASYSASGYFKLSNGLFMSILGNFSAYLIVMLQFAADEGKGQ